jgi:hypothetical protein
VVAGVEVVGPAVMVVVVAAAGAVDGASVVVDEGGLVDPDTADVSGARVVPSTADVTAAMGREVGAEATPEVVVIGSIADVPASSVPPPQAVMNASITAGTRLRTLIRPPSASGWLRARTTP